MADDVAENLKHLNFYELEPEAHLPDRAEIDRLQVEHACSVGEDYAAFLSRYRPGGFRHSVLAPLEPGGPMGKAFNVDLVYGLGSRDEWNPFLLKASTYSSQIPAAYLPIAADPGGNLLLLQCGKGTIYAWDHEHRELGPGGFSRIVKDLEHSGVDVSIYDIGQLILLWENAHAGEIANPTGHGNFYLVAESFAGLIAKMAPGGN